MNEVCPYCRAPVAEGEARVVCPACETVHHEECWQENGGCTVFGCSQTPVEEAKIQVSAHDLEASPASSAAGMEAPPLPPADPGALVDWSAVPPLPFEAGVDVSLPPPLPELPPPGMTGVAPPAMTPEYVRPATPSGLTLLNVSAPPPVVMAARAPAGFAASSRSRTVYILLGVLLGFLGVHNFYAGYTIRGVIQMLLTLFTCMAAAILIWIWAVVEVCIVRRDGDGFEFI